MTDLTTMYGSMVFSDSVMKQRLPIEIYNSLSIKIKNGTRLNSEEADAVADAMRDWAVELGATHYTHWFAPMTGITAEKHDSFLTPTNDGKAIVKFSRNALIHGETDASSFPSGGLRATFEARGYTAWDPTSNAFIRGNTLYIPTAFCSYGGEALDEKTPLLRSMNAINKQATRVLELFNFKDRGTVVPMVGAEQEYFLIDKSMFEKRKDLLYTGRTLLGAKSPKGQELEDQYYGSIKPRVSAFMKNLDQELWKLGVPAKTKHNEAAPAQHELAVMHTSANLATDHNQLIMELMQSIAQEHGMICTLHEKPFEGINGSGKHNNWSLNINHKINLLDPGKTPHENKVFLLFLVAVIKAVDDYQGLYRISTASAGNDCRLGGGEAPPAIISVFIGDELLSIFNAIENDVPFDPSKHLEVMKLSATGLPSFKKDTTDRNRTSPFAFTGNKFEFRMVGAKMSIAKANIIINTTVAESLRLFANELSQAADFDTALNTLIKNTIINHKRIIFNGNNYSDEWTLEASSRGLLNLKTTPEALTYLLSEKNIQLFERHGVLTREELESRYEISLENYCKLCNIEAITMYKLIKKCILPTGSKFSGKLLRIALDKIKYFNDAKELCSYEKHTATRLSEITAELHKNVAVLYDEIDLAEKQLNLQARSEIYRNSVLSTMSRLRLLSDEMELLVPRKLWPFPTYGDLLFSVR